MLSWRPQDHIQFVATCNPQWLRMYEFMLVACRRFINNCANSRTELWTQTCATRALANYVFLPFFSWECVTYLCATSMHGCICMLVCVWLYDNVRIMSWWRTQDHIQWVTACHPTWLRMYQFMLVEILGEVPEGSAADTGCGSGGFRCRYLFRFLALVPLPLCSTIALYAWGLQAVNKKWNEAETFKLLGIAPEFIFLGKLWFVGISSVGGG